MAGPMKIVGSNGISPILPIITVISPVRNPNRKNAHNHTIEIGSIIAIYHPGTRGINSIVKDRAIERALNMAAPAISKARER